MGLFLGTTTTNDLYLGTTKIQKVYLGTTQMYSAVSVNLASNATFSGEVLRLDTDPQIFTFITDGTITVSSTGVMSGNTSVWTEPSPSAGAGNAFWIKVVGTKTDNAPPFNFYGTYNTWLPMSTDQSFGIAKTDFTVGTSAATFDIQIASDASGTNIVDSGQFVMSILYYTEQDEDTNFNSFDEPL